MSDLMTIPSKLSTAVNRRFLSRKYSANVVNVPETKCNKPFGDNPTNYNLSYPHALLVYFLTTNSNNIEPGGI